MPTPYLSSPFHFVREAPAEIPHSSEINALIKGVVWGRFLDRFYNNSIELTFSFPWTSDAMATFGGFGGGQYSTLDEPSADYYFGLNPTQQMAARNALEAWGNVSKISFVEVHESSSNVGDLRFGFTSVPFLANDGNQAWGWAYYPDSQPSAGDVWISSLESGAENTDWSIGSYNYEALLHELGHSLGLKHPFESSITLPESLDTKNYSIMSYTNGPNSLFVQITENNDSYSWRSFFVSPDTPMLYDIAAIQYLYGANYSYNSGDTTYTFDPNTPFMRTIWDGGGRDTISVENFTKGCVINLVAGQFSKITIESDVNDEINWDVRPPIPTYDGTNNLAIAFDCEIENAIGSTGDDIIIGNHLDNIFTGNFGNDALNGGDGLDTVIYSGRLSEYGGTIASRTIIDLVANRDGTDTLAHIERLQFADTMLALDTGANENAGNAYLLYQAAFDRIPDVEGLGYWISQVDQGADIVTEVAMNFILSDEFKRLYGPDPTVTEFMDLIYQNVLNRTPDAAGYAYWLDEFARDGDSLAYRASILNNFAISDENVANVADQITDGIQYQAYVG